MSCFLRLQSAHNISNQFWDRYKSTSSERIKVFLHWAILVIRFTWFISCTDAQLLSEAIISHEDLVISVKKASTCWRINYWSSMSANGALEKRTLVGDCSQAVWGQNRFFGAQTCVVQALTAPSIICHIVPSTKRHIHTVVLYGCRKTCKDNCNLIPSS